MRKHKHWPIAIGLLLCAFALLWMLSALVEAPAADAPRPLPMHQLADAVFLPANPTAGEAAATARAMISGNPFIVLFAAFALTLPTLAKGRDANGRILRRRSYVRSFYPVFKQELACG